MQRLGTLILSVEPVAVKEWVICIALLPVTGGSAVASLSHSGLRSVIC